MNHEVSVREGEDLARKPRIHYEGAWCHVICRGNNRSYVFENDTSKNNYLEILQHYKKKYEFKLYCYYIMDNHAHLLIEVAKEPLRREIEHIGISGA